MYCTIYVLCDVLPVRVEFLKKTMSTYGTMYYLCTHCVCKKLLQAQHGICMYFDTYYYSASVCKKLLQVHSVVNRNALASFSYSNVIH